MIQIVFDTIDLQGGSKIVLWNGAKSLNSEDDGFGNIEYSLPSGGDATYAMNMGNTVFTSSAADGAVTVFFSNICIVLQIIMSSISASQRDRKSVV